MTLTFSWQRTLLFVGFAVAVAACSTAPQITRTQDVSESADTPYRNVLVIALFKSFAVRRSFEKEVVKQLSERGIDAVASTSLMDTKTPTTRQTFLAMVEKLGSDGVLVTKLVDIDSEVSKKDARPEATYKGSPTHYYNVWNVELTEYVEPPIIKVKSSVVLATQMYSARSQEAVWAIESKFKIVQDVSQPTDYPIMVDEAKAIVRHLLKDGLIAQ